MRCSKQFVTWATSTGKMSTLLNKVVDSVSGRIT
jgi:hypothetical protein